MVKQSNDTYIKIVAVIAIVGIAWMFFGTGTETQSSPATINWPGSTPAASSQQGQTIVVSAPTPEPVEIQGTLDVEPVSSTGTTAVTSKALFLEKSMGILNDGVLDERATTYKLMKLHQDKDLAAFTAFGGGTPAENSFSSGKWSPTITGKVGDEILVFTYADKTPAAAENISTVKLFKLKGISPGTDKWSATMPDGSTKWNLYNYYDGNWTDGNGVVRENYTYGDGGTIANDVVIRWYVNASVAGQKCRDCAIFVSAPTNFTSKFKSLVVSDKFGHSTDDGSHTPLTSLRPASNIAGIDIIETILPAITDTNYKNFFLGFIPDDFETLRTSAQKNELSFVLTSDSYGGNTVPIRFHIVQNARALGTTNGPFQFTQSKFTVTFSRNTNTGFEVNPQ